MKKGKSVNKLPAMNEFSSERISVSYTSYVVDLILDPYACAFYGFSMQSR